MRSFEQDLSLLEAVAIAGKVTGPGRQAAEGCFGEPLISMKME